MIGLDSYSRQVFIYLDTISIYISLRINCLLEIRKIAVFPLAFIAEWLQGHWWGFISRNYVVWPTFLLMNVFIALKGSHFWFLSPRGGTGSTTGRVHVTGWKKESFKLIHALFHLQAFQNFGLYVFSICQTLGNIAPHTELITVQSPIVCSTLACITVKSHAHL